MLEIAQGYTIEEVVADPEHFLAHSGLVKNPKTLLKDGWGKDFDIRANGSDITIHSDAYRLYKNRKNSKLPSRKETAVDEE